MEKCGVGCRAGSSTQRKSCRNSTPRVLVFTTAYVERHGERQAGGKRTRFQRSFDPKGRGTRPIVVVDDQEPVGSHLVILIDDMTSFFRLNLTRHVQSVTSRVCVCVSRPECACARHVRSVRVTSRVCVCVTSRV